MDYQERNVELITKMQSLDVDSLEYQKVTKELLELNEPLMIFALKRFKVTPKHPNYDDYMQELRIAMLRSAKTYDVTGNVKFSTYATNMFRNIILFVDYNKSVISGIGHAKEELYRSEQDLKNQGVLNPSFDEIVNNTHTTRPKSSYVSALQAMNTKSLDAPISENTYLIDVISDHHQGLSDLQKEKLNQIEIALQYINRESAKYFTEKYINGLSGMQIAEKYKVKHQWVSSKILKAIESIQYLLEEKHYGLLSKMVGMKEQYEFAYKKTHEKMSLNQMLGKHKITIAEFFEMVRLGLYGYHQYSFAFDNEKLINKVLDKLKEENLDLIRDVCILRMDLEKVANIYHVKASEVPLKISKAMKNFQEKLTKTHHINEDTLTMENKSS